MKTPFFKERPFEIEVVEFNDIEEETDSNDNVKGIMEELVDQWY